MGSAGWRAYAPADSAGRRAAADIRTTSARYGRPHAKAARGAADGMMATSAAPATPAHMRAVTSRPAAALVAGENGLSVPNVTMESGAVAASAANPVATGPESAGGSQRRRPNSYGLPKTAMPATARYDSLNESACALSGRSARATANTIDSVASGAWGRSAAAVALATQNISTARNTEGDAPTMYRYTPASAQAAVLARNGPSANPRSSETKPASMLTCWPESASMWAQPACLKSSARAPSRSSRTPTTRASRRGPASPPARDSAPRRASLAAARIVPSRGGGPMGTMSAASTKAVRPARASGQAPWPVRGGNTARFSVTRTSWPRTGHPAPTPTPAAAPPLPAAFPVPAFGLAYTAIRPPAVTRAPSEASAALVSRSQPVMPPAVLRGSEATLPSYAVTRVPQRSEKPGLKAPETASARPWDTAPRHRPAASAAMGRNERPEGSSERPVVDFFLLATFHRMMEATVQARARPHENIRDTGPGGRYAERTAPAANGTAGASGRREPGFTAQERARTHRRVQPATG